MLNLSWFLVDEEEEEIIAMLMRSCPHSIFQSRKSEGIYANLVTGHLRNDEERVRNFFRLNPCQFDFVLSLVKEDIAGTSTSAVQNPIEADEKMAMTLRFLATGESFVFLGYGFWISPSYVSIIVRETLEAMCQHVAPIFLPPPSRKSFRKSAKEFYTLSGFPNCCAAIDGKHIRIWCPVKSGSLFWNYKGYFSTALLALVDANCKFVAIDVGSYGKEGDSGMFNKSVMGKMIIKGDVFPADEELPLTEIKMPFVIVGDEAFRLRKHILKPYTHSSA